MNTQGPDNDENWEIHEPGVGVEYSSDSQGFYWVTWLSPAGFGLDGPFGPFDSQPEARADAIRAIEARAAIYDQGKIMSGEQVFND